MKGFYICILLCFYGAVFGQNKDYTVLIRDIETSLPIENATLVVSKTKQILLSNSEGKVTFTVNGSTSLQVSEMMYETEMVRWADLAKNEFIIYLKSKNNQLDEIVLSNEIPQKTLKKIITNSIKKFTIPSRLKVYVREFFKLNDVYACYNDGLVNFQFSLENKKIKTVLLVEQNRSFGLVASDISDDLLGYNLNDIMEKYTSFAYLEPLLDSNILKKYEFVIKTLNSNSKFQIMSATPLEDAKNVLDEFDIIYDAEQKVITQYTVRASPKRLADIKERNSSSFKNYTKSVVTIGFRLNESNYFLIRANEVIGFYVIQNDAKKSFQVSNEFFTTQFDTQVFSYGDHNVFKEKTLFNKSNKILTNYWDLSGFTATEEERKVIQSLEGMH